MIVRKRLSSPGFCADEDRHRDRVAGHDHHQVLALVLHLLDQGVDRLGAVLVAGERVRLVDEEDAADRRRHHLGGLDRGLAEEAGHQLGPVDLDQLALAEQAERPVDAGHQPRDRGLAGAGVAVEDQVPGDRGRPQPGVLAQPLDPEHGRLPVDLGLDLGQPDQGVELGEQLLDRLRRRLRLLRHSATAAWCGGADDSSRCVPGPDREVPRAPCPRSACGRRRAGP